MKNLEDKKIYDVFIAHVEEDADIALEIAVILEQAGYTTWTYEIDSIPGPSYLVQTGQAVESSKAFVVLISPHSLGSKQLTKEVVRAHEAGKEFIPVRRDVSHVEFQTRQPEWREAVGAASSISVTTDGVEVVANRIIDGLKALGIHPKPKADTARIGQIRKILDKIRESGTTGEAAGPTRKYEEAATREVPSAKPGRPRKFIKFGGIAAATVVVIAVVVVLFTVVLAKCELITSVSPDGGGTVAPTGGNFNDGTEVTLTAVPTQGYAFDGWSGDVTGKTSPVTLAMNGDKSVVAHFKIQYTLSAAASPDGGGTVTPVGGSYDNGAEVTLAAVPAQGYAFDRWSGDITGKTSPFTLAMNGNKSVVAHFNKIFLEDQFTDNRNEWYVDEQNYIANGVYNTLIVEKDPDVTATRKNFKWPDDSPGFARFGFEADVITIQSEDSMGRGIVFLCDPAKPAESDRPQREYMFLITGGGEYKLAYEIDHDFINIIPWTTSPFLNTGRATNRLKVICRDTNIEIYANDHLLATAKGEFPTVIGDNGIGVLTCGNDGTHIAFDNIRMWEISD